MKKHLSTLLVVVLCLALTACGSKKDSPASVAQKWCDLNAKAYKAADGSAREAAEATRKKFEKDMEQKYDKAFMKEVETEVEKCEDASEGR